MFEKKLDQLSSIEYFKEYSKFVSHLLANLDFHAIDKVAHLVIESAQTGGTIYFAGNGGSAALASHYATDFSHGIMGKTGKLVKAVSLAANMSHLSAIANDHGYENVFVNQLQHILKPEDVVVVISASGNSPNVVKAAEFANEKGATTVGIVGFDGGKLKQICTYAIHVETEKGQYGPVEDVHSILDHMMATYLMIAMKDNQTA